MQRARYERDQTHSCGHALSVCSDKDREWFPQRTICYPTMETEAAASKWAALHEQHPYHDGTFKSWAKDRSDSHPYHFQAGVTVWVAETDLNPHDHFLGGRSACEECMNPERDAAPDVEGG